MKYSYLLLLLLTACHNNSVKIIELDVAPNTIPEGIAIDPTNRDIYLSSIYLDKITKSDAKGQVIQDLIQPGQYDYSIGLGMDIQQNYLFALGRINRTNKSLLLQIDLRNQQLVKRYQLADTIPSHFNDLALDKDLNAYITDTESHRVYKLDYASGQIELFLENKGIKYPNGITISDDQTKLFVDSFTSGIRIIDIASKTILNQIHLNTTELGIDGLKYYQNQLFGVVNGSPDLDQHSLARLQLSADESQIIKTDLHYFRHPLFNIPTTFAIVKNDLYLLANSQMENLDQENNTIIDEDQLTPTYILKLNL